MNETTIYCPFCGRPLDERPSGYHCDVGRVRLASWVADDIRAALEAPVAPLDDSRAAAARPTTWFCPRCAAPLVARDDHYLGARCPRCGFELSGASYYLLTEHHTHVPAAPPGR